MRRVLVLSCLILLACGASEPEPASTVTGARGVTVGGAADIEELRGAVRDGSVPSPALLDDVGFFAEHALDLPEDSCEDDLCVLSSLAVAPRFNGGNWAMAYVALQTALDPASLPREPVHVVVGMERSSHTQLDSLALRGQISALAQGLRPEDRISVFSFDDEAELLIDRLPTGELDEALDSTPSGDGGPDVDLFAALAFAEQLASAEPELRSQTLIVASGERNVGITDEERLVGRAAAMAASGQTVSVVAYRAEQTRLLRNLAEQGAGTYSYTDLGRDLDDILRAAGETSLHPLATDFELVIEPAEGYALGTVHGAGTVDSQADRVVIRAPGLFIASRSGSGDTTEGRRGGGSGFFIELHADPDSGVGPRTDAFYVNATWTSSEGQAQDHNATIQNILAPGENPDDMWPSFSNLQVTKPFMMLNMYLALRLQLEMYQSGDCQRAQGVVPMIETMVEGWQRAYMDPDIDADYELINDIDANIANECQVSEPIQPTDTAYSGCMFL